MYIYIGHYFNLLTFNSFMHLMALDVDVKNNVPVCSFDLFKHAMQPVLWYFLFV